MCSHSVQPFEKDVVMHLAATRVQGLLVLKQRWYFTGPVYTLTHIFCSSPPVLVVS